jgi:hypothetical protein
MTLVLITQQLEEDETLQIAPVKISLGLSKQKRLPCLKVNNQAIWPWEYSQYKEVENLKLALTQIGLQVTKEMLRDGHLYLPKFSLKGKTVLDIGACCGESANIFLKAGAKKVVCIEPNLNRVKYIEFNKKNLGWNVDVIPEKAAPKHIIETSPDLIKCDIEGYEMDLIDYLPKYPCVLEVHNYWIRDKFAERGFHELIPPDPMLGQCLMGNKAFLTP